MPSRPEISIPAALATGSVVIALYQRNTPTNLDMRAAQVGDRNAEAVRKQQAWLSAAAVGAISLVAKDPTIFIVGGTMVVVLDWLTRANIWTNPVTGQVEGSAVLRSVTPRAGRNEQAMGGREYAPSEGVIA